MTALPADSALLMNGEPGWFLLTALATQQDKQTDQLHPYHDHDHTLRSDAQACYPVDNQQQERYAHGKHAEDVQHPDQLSMTSCPCRRPVFLRGGVQKAQELKKSDE